MSAAEQERGAPLLALENASFREDGRLVFPRSRWVWRRGERWAVLGANAGGKSFLALALAGRVMPFRGELRMPADGDGLPDAGVALLSPGTHRDALVAESSFYQSRWHGGVFEGRRTVAQMLARDAVEGRNPFEVGISKRGGAAFARRRREIVRRLRIARLTRRRFAVLSNGEQRRVLLAQALLRAKRLLLLDDPFGGLDRAARPLLRGAVDRLMRGGLPVLVFVSRADEIPTSVTHLLLVGRHRILAQGPVARVLRHPFARRLAGDIAPVPASASPTEPSAAGVRCAAPLVELRGASIVVGERAILRNFTWMVRAGERWAVLGPNGAGKTTLLGLIHGDHPQAYAVDMRLFGRRADATHTLWEARRLQGWFSQELHLHHPPQWECLDVVCSGFFQSIGLFESPAPRQRAAARRSLREMGLEAVGRRAFGEVPFAVQRLVLLARAMVARPRLLILDEPCQGLDAARREQVLQIVNRAASPSSSGLIFVTHHPREMPPCITHVLRLSGGRIVRKGPRVGRRPD